MITNDNKLPMFFNNQGEVDLILNVLQPHHTVLEWGTGASTITMAKRVKAVCAIEHVAMWYEKVRQEVISEGLQDKVFLVHVPQNSQHGEFEDGTLQNYRQYVQAPIALGQIFDVVLIDGRARVECAKVAAELLAPDGVIFIHDYKHPEEKYRRREYEVIETFLEEIDHVFALSKFRKK